MAVELTKDERAALVKAEALFAQGRRALTSSLMAAQMGSAHDTRKWAGVMTSLANKGLLKQHKDGFVNKTFWTAAS